MARRLLAALCALAAFGAAIWSLAAPAWSLEQCAALLLLGVSMSLVIGRIGGVFTVLTIVSVLGSDSGGEGALTRVFLPVIGMLAGGGMLACVVLRNPSLGRRIEHGPFGPGGA